MSGVTASAAISAHLANPSVAPQAISDTAADLLANISGLDQLAAEGGIASVMLTGTSNKITASQATELASLPGFTRGTATLVVDDTAANLLSVNDATGVALATSVQLTGNNTVTAAQIKTLAALPSFSKASGAQLEVVDTAVNLLAASATISGYATGTQMTGFNTVTAAQATALVRLPGFALAAGATMTVADSASNLLSSSTWIGKATGVAITGTANTVNVAQADKLAVLPHVALAAGATLIIADSAANLLYSTAVVGEALATSVVLTGTSNTVSVAQATRLAALRGFAIGPGATLTVADTGANLVGYTNVIPGATLSMTGDSVVNAAQANSLARMPNLTKSSTAVLHVDDTAANLLTLSPKAVILASYEILDASATVSAAQLATLAGYGHFGFSTGVILTVADTAAALFANITNVARYAIVTIVTGNNTVTAAQAASLATCHGLVVELGATLLIDDTYADIQGMLASVASLAAGYGLPGNYTEIATAAPASAAAALQAGTQVVSFTIADTAANLGTAALIALEADNKLTGIDVTTPDSVNVTYAQYSGLSHVLGMVTGSYTVNVSDAPVGAAASIQESPNVGQFTIADTATDLSANVLVALEADTKLTAIDVTSPATINITYNQYLSLTNVLAELSGSYSLNVLDVPVTDEASIRADSQITSFSLVSPSAGNDTGGASGRGGSLLPAGYLSTDGNQIVDANGNPVRIDSIGWAGTDSLTFAPYGLWQTNLQSDMNAIKADGFNTIRIPWSDELLTASPEESSNYAAINFSLNPSLYGLNSLQLLQAMVTDAGNDGLKVIFDHHDNNGGPGGWGGQQANGLWYDRGPGTNGTDGSGTTGTVSAAQFEADTVTLAQTFAGNPTVIGFDLDNEPTSAGKVNWGQGGPTDIQAMYTQVGDAVQAVDPGALIIAEGPEEWSGPAPGMPAGFAEGDLSGVATDPVTLTIPDKVVYSVHEYPPDLSGNGSYNLAQQIAAMNAGWGYLETDNIAPVWVGEMGSDMTSTQDSAWIQGVLNYMDGYDGTSGGPTFTGDEQPVSGSWWQWGSSPGSDPDGVLTSWTGTYQPAQQVATDQLEYDPTGTASTTAAVTSESSPPPGMTFLAPSFGTVLLDGSAVAPVAGTNGIATVINTGLSTISGWTVELATSDILTGFTGAVVTQPQAGVYIVTAASNDATLASGGYVSFGFTTASVGSNPAITAYVVTPSTS